MHTVVTVIRAIMFVTYDAEFDMFILTVVAITCITSRATFSSMISTALFSTNPALIDITAPLAFLYLAHCTLGRHDTRVTATGIADNANDTLLLFARGTQELHAQFTLDKFLPRVTRKT